MVERCRGPVSGWLRLIDCDTNTVTVVKAVRVRGVTWRSTRSLRELLTLDELTDRVGMSVRNIRFYTTKGLVPPPIRRGRSGYYSPDHVARLELVQELQSHGFTLSAIEKYVAGIPADATPEDIALRRTMLAPWQADQPVEMSRAELEKRGRPRAHRRGPRRRWRARHRLRRRRRRATRSAVSQLRSASACSTSASRSRRPAPPPRSTPSTASEIAHELYDVFRTMVWPVYQESGASPETIQERGGAAQAAVDRQPGVGVRGRDAWTRPATREAIARTGRERSAAPGR